MVLGGVAVQVPESALETLRTLPGVVSVMRDEARPAITDRSPGFIGAPKLRGKLGGPANAGEGVIIGVIDSGIWPEHPSFADPDPKGKPYAVPPGMRRGRRHQFLDSRAHEPLPRSRRPCVQRRGRRRDLRRRDEVYFGSCNYSAGMAASTNGACNFTTPFAASATPGTYHVLALADSEITVIEHDEANNVTVMPGTVVVQ